MLRYSFAVAQKKLHSWWKNIEVKRTNQDVAMTKMFLLVANQVGLESAAKKKQSESDKLSGKKGKGKAKVKQKSTFEEEGVVAGSLELFKGILALGEIHEPGGYPWNAEGFSWADASQRQQDMQKVCSMKLNSCKPFGITCCSSKALLTKRLPEDVVSNAVASWMAQRRSNFKVILSTNKEDHSINNVLLQNASLISLRKLLRQQKVASLAVMPEEGAQENKIPVPRLRFPPPVQVGLSKMNAFFFL